MTYWILPWNKAVYDLPQSLKDYGFVDWKQRNKLKVGDIVFIYCSSPVRQLVYMMEVTKVNLTLAESVNDHYLFKDEHRVGKSGLCARLVPISQASIPTQELSYATLKALGLTAQLQGGTRVPDFLLDHILNNFRRYQNP